MKFKGPWKSLPVLAAAVGFLYACGDAKYQKQDYQATAVAGQYTHPKIDIVVFQDNSDSVMMGPINDLNLAGFLNSIDSRWDFHFTVLPLLKAQSMEGKYVVAKNCADLSADVVTCLSPSQASRFNGAAADKGWIRSVNSQIGSDDRGFKYIKQNLSHSSMTNSGFFRPDAALAIIVLSNGDDLEGVGLTERDDGVLLLNYNTSAAKSSFKSYKKYLSGLRGSADLSKFYAVVSTTGGSCLGADSIYGQRYIDMASKVTGLKGDVYNICSGGLGNTLNNIGQHLQSLIEAILFNYVVVEQEPMTSSLKITKNGVEIPQGGANGWEYVGYRANHPTSYSPALGNNKTGYFIKLNGTAVYKGSDVITVDFQRN